MYKVLLPITFAVILTACISEEERLGSQYQFQSIIQDQCEQMGFKMGTTQSMQCQMFYEDVFKYEIDNYWSYSRVQQVENKMYQMRDQCQNYWGNKQISPSALWLCVQKKGQAMKEQAEHERQLKEQEELMRNAIADGQKSAYEDARIQARIDEERNRVAQLTGKNPKKIYCSTSTKANGYVKVKCK